MSNCNQRKFYFNLQLMSLCEICGRNQVIPVTQDMYSYIQAFQKGEAGWILDKDFIVIGGYAMRPENVKAN